MAEIRTGINLQDSFSPVLYSITSAVSGAINSISQMQQMMGANVDFNMGAATAEVDDTTESVRALTEALAGISAPTIAVGFERPDWVEEARQRAVSSSQLANPPPVSVSALQKPVSLDLMPDSATAGVASAGQQLQAIGATEQSLQQAAAGVNLMPDSATAGVASAGQQLQAIGATEQSLQQAAAGVNLMPDSATAGVASAGQQLQAIGATEQSLQQAAAGVNLMPDSATAGVASAGQQLQATTDSATESIQRVTQAEQGAAQAAQWLSDIEIFNSSGAARYAREVESAQEMLQSLNTTQQRISRTAAGLDILPGNAAAEISAISQRITGLQSRIQQISKNRINIGSDRANAELERLRKQLQGAIYAQEELNEAIAGADVGRINASYLRLSGSIRGAEAYIRDNTNKQGQFNQSLQRGVDISNRLTSAIKSAVAAYASVAGVRKLLDISDELAMTTARLDVMNQAFNAINGTATETSALVNQVYLAAQNARGSFNDMAAVVAKFGNNARDAFSNQDEVVAFANLVQKQMTIAGASTTEASNALLQLSQALGSGVLRGDELRSIFEQAPNLIQNIADYMEVPIGQIRNMAAEGQLTADIVKAAIFAASDDINAKFENMPRTWGQLWTTMSNAAVMRLQPVLNKLSELANNERVQMMLSGALTAVSMIAVALLNAMDIAGSVAAFFADHWSVIAPVVYGVVAALTVYRLAALAVAAATGIAAAAQMVFNAILAANPILLIVMGVVALIAAIYGVMNAVAKTTSAATSGLGLIAGGVNVVIQFFKNMALSVANVFAGIGSAAAALASNFITLFKNSIASVESFFYSLLSTALSVIAQIANGLNRLPFVEIDVSGLTSAAGSYASKAQAAYDSRGKYKDVTQAMVEGFGTFTIDQNWVSSAFSSGAAWGDSIVSGISSRLGGISNAFKVGDAFNIGDYIGDIAGLDGIGSDVSDIAGSTGAIAGKLDITDEALKYLRDIAEKETVNRFTTAEIRIDQTNNNSINGDMDLDGIVNSLTDAVNEAISEIAEGVHY